MNARIILILLCITLLSCQTPNEKLIIATAANMQYAMKELKIVFEKQHNSEIELVIGSSGKLTAQIKEGAPFDVFASADTKYPEEIFKNGGAKMAPKIYATGTLILWSKNIPTEDLSLDILISDHIHKIATANPRNAPYGVAAEQVLHNLGIYEKVKNKLVFGESISQTAQYIVSGAAEVGFNALSVALSPDLKEKGIFVIIPDSLHQPIRQSVILLNHSPGSPKLEASRQFYDFLTSSEAKTILIKYGFK